MRSKVYLRQNILAEPLFNQWYAWSYLIPPATAAMYMANSHLKIMRSFVDAPQVHISALKNPAMVGGPFINYDESRKEEIKALMEKTVKEQAGLLKLADSLKRADSMVVGESEGLSMEPLYKRIPDALRGYVELVYDLNNHPSIRLIEGLLYKSPYYSESSQSMALSFIHKDGRPFVFSTPRLESDECVRLKVHFSHQGVDELFKMKRTPQPIDFIKELLTVGPENAELFSSFFGPEAPQPAPRYVGSGVRIRYFGHACVLIESRDVRILIDPLISYKYDNATPRYTYADLPETIDYALITHNHQDHCMFETLLQLRHAVKHFIVPKSNGGGLADPSLKLMLQNIGFDSVREIDEMETLKFEGGEIISLPFLGEHADLAIRSKNAYLVKIGEQSILCAADSNNIDPSLYEHIHDVIGDVDVVFLGMECVGGPLTWLYGPLLVKPISHKLDQSRRFDGSNCEKGIDMVNQLNPKQVYVYAMGQEPWLTYLTTLYYDEESPQIIESNKLVQECRRRGIRSENLFGYKEIYLGS